MLKLIPLVVAVCWLTSWLPRAAQAQNQPDLVVVAPFTTPATVVAGGSYTMSGVIRNQGTNGAQFNCIGYYLSTDATWDGTDAYLGASCQSLLFPGQSGTCSIVGRIPMAAPGAYQLLLVADPLNAERESDETNNVVAFPIAVTAGTVPLPDLELWRPSLSFSTLPAGGSTGVFSFINNKGPGAAPVHEIGFYLSTDTVFSVATDVLLGQMPGPGLAGITGGATAVGTVFSAPVLPIPVTTVPGQYYLLVVIDPRNNVVESDEGNNSRALPLRVTGPLSIGTPLTAADVAVYPNPISRGALLAVELGRPVGAATELTLLDLTGQIVRRQQVASTERTATLNTEGLAAGVYVLHLRSNARTIAQRVLVN